MLKGIYRIYQRPRMIAWLLVSRNWYLLPATFLIGISFPMFSEEDGIEKRHPHAIGYEQSVLADSAGAAVKHVTFSYKSRANMPLMVAFNEDDDRRSFDYIQVGRSDKQFSGVFAFRDGRSNMLEACPGLGKASSGVMTISHADGLLEVASIQGDPCIVRLSRFDAPLRFFNQFGTFMRNDKHVDILEMEVVGGEAWSTEPEETRDLFQLLSKAVVSGLLVCFQVWLVFFILLFLFCPLKFYQAHPHGTLFLFSAGTIILAVLFFMVIVQPSFQKQGDANMWHSKFTVNGRIDRDTVEQASVIDNVGCLMAKEKTSAFRIVVLGGSSTYGVPYDACHASTYPSQMQSYFDVLTAGNRSLTGKDQRCVEVMNLGSRGASLKYHLTEAYEKVVLPHLDPDVVVLKSSHNDYITQNIIILVFEYLSVMLADVDWSWPWIDVGPYQQHLQRIVDLARDQDVKLLFVEDPINTDAFSGHNPIKAFQTAMAEIAEVNGIPFIEAQKAFDHPRGRFLFFDSVHLTWMGNKLLADMILEAIERYELLDPSVCIGKIDRENRRSSDPFPLQPDGTR